MSRETDTVKLLKTLLGSYSPSGKEVERFAGVAKLNKLYLAYLRRVGDSLWDELVHEEARYRWFTRNAAEVVGVLESIGATYALYKFRRPFEHVSVDLDILVRVEDVPRAVRALVSRGFKVVVWEPYTATLDRGGFIVDLYTHPSFAWVVYMDGGGLLDCCVEEVDVGDLVAKALSREAEVAVAAAHAVYKEHLVLLMDCLVAWSWLNKRAWNIAAEHRVEESLEMLLETCSLIRNNLVEAPCRLKPSIMLRAYMGKLVNDPLLRGTLLNIAKYFTSRRDIGEKIVSRITRKSY
ncbi:nucleotidyltransferase family protein [Thermosphaera aggregans]|uniref:Nucleotidyltransferase family protein n=1 Tax=Thermosphaera aggregans (strain DSM 11486 / M11TL) TaxID=633148 RepID=D5U141_THEAM|nr:nucleotidyltransferase family protein [Thermosphaera aggregans]ADG90841.1 hypothetical protein Tagg_0567 [Thermosphaera aggregans DSM 11486]